MASLSLSQPLIDNMHHGLTLPDVSTIMLEDVCHIRKYNCLVFLGMMLTLENG